MFRVPSGVFGVVLVSRIRLSPFSGMVWGYEELFTSSTQNTSTLHITTVIILHSTCVCVPHSKENQKFVLRRQLTCLCNRDAWFLEVGNEFSSVI